MRKYLIGILIGCALSFSYSAYAEVISMIGKTIDGQYKVKINGSVFPNSAIVVNGASYLPVRSFGEATGYDVAFLKDEIQLTKKNIGVPIQTQIIIIDKEITDLTNVTPEYQKRMQEAIDYMKKNGATDEEINNDFFIRDSKIQIKYFQDRIQELTKQKTDLETQLSQMP